MKNKSQLQNLNLSAMTRDYTWSQAIIWAFATKGREDLLGHKKNILKIL